MGLNDGVRGMKIAYSPTLGYAKDVHPEVAAAVHAAALALQDQGAIVELVDPGFEDPLEISTGLWFVGAYVVWSGLSPQQQAPMTAEAMLGWTPFSYPFNLTQQPACSMPCGLTSDGLPIGLQLVGPMFGDALVLRAARAYESAHPIARANLDLLL